MIKTDMRVESTHQEVTAGLKAMADMKISEFVCAFLSLKTLVVLLSINFVNNLRVLLNLHVIKMV